MQSSLEDFVHCLKVLQKNEAFESGMFEIAKQIALAQTGRFLRARGFTCIKLCPFPKVELGENISRHAESLASVTSHAAVG